MSKNENRKIMLNQIGYPSDGQKIAVFTGSEANFQVVDAVSGDVVFDGQTGSPMVDKVSGVSLWRGDFSEVHREGKYRIQQGELGSAVFTISDKPYHELQQGLLKAFYYYRCGAELTEEYAGSWQHKACHTTKGIVYGQPELVLDCSGGWHDAGDYGKYSGPGAKAVADLLLAYEMYPTAFSSPLPIPESNGHTPDVLLECRVELDWLFKMQESGTGGVYHKLTTQHFPGLDVMPEDDTSDLYFSPVSATATGNFAGVMAMAGRVYQPFDKEYAKKCREAAAAAWEWLKSHASVSGFKNPVEISTGEYGDEQDLDERYWAAAELYRTTGESVYHDAFKELASSTFPKYMLGWADMGGYGSIAYLLNDAVDPQDPLYISLKEGLVTEVQRLTDLSRQDGYLISLQEEDYIWGSNMLVMNNAMLMLVAERISGSPGLADSALDHLHYIMGRNVMDISYVTGFGDRPVMKPHHRPSVGDGVLDPVPGLVSGGPNRGLHDEYVVEHLQGKPAAQCFADHELSYSTNEVTIYWNSPAVFVTARFNA